MTFPIRIGMLYSAELPDRLKSRKDKRIYLIL